MERMKSWMYVDNYTVDDMARDALRVEQLEVEKECLDSVKDIIGFYMMSIDTYRHFSDLKDGVNNKPNEFFKLDRNSIDAEFNSYIIKFLDRLGVSSSGSRRYCQMHNFLKKNGFYKEANETFEISYNIIKTDAIYLESELERLENEQSDEAETKIRIYRNIADVARVNKKIVNYLIKMSNELDNVDYLNSSVVPE